ncbi:hypothetical protein N8I77_001178 [Diaporthe amygdali]|uniref:Uncharacterized protein n=1 Tax=Phomopsis amygdali TaxID=1214568 RepID=A0AAD9W9U3_PHOAM|nr:hypothetical protein N8I77_001178 [Diaporthe amygdali]
MVHRQAGSSNRNLGKQVVLKACVDDPVDAGQRFKIGFCGWEAIDRAHSHTMTSHGHIAKETKGEAQPAQEQIHNSDNNNTTSNTTIERKQGN